MANLIVDLLMDGSLKAEYFDPSIVNEPRALALVELLGDTQDSVFDVIWSLHGGNYMNFYTNPIMLAVLEKLGGEIVSGQLILGRAAVTTLTNLADVQ